MPAQTPDDTPADSGCRPTLFVLLAANLLVALQALQAQWGFHQLVLVYWFEALIIGGFNALRMAVVGLAGHRPLGTRLARRVGMTPAARILATVLATGFFVVTFGGVALATGFWVVVMLPALSVPAPNPAERVLAALGDAVPGLVLPVAALLVSHAVSFVWNFLVRGEYRRQSLPGLVFLPYLRMALALGVVVGGLLVAGLHPDAATGPFLVAAAVALKTALDAATHAWEHRRAGRRPPGLAATA